MRVLLIESSPGEAFELEDRLVADGHRVVSCDDPAGGPCIGIDSPADCPLSTHVDLAVLVQPPFAPPSLHEVGVVCARRHRVPIVRVEDSGGLLELGAPGEIESAALHASRRVSHQFAERIERELAEWDAVATVGRSRDRITVTVRVPSRHAVDSLRVTIADRARAAARAYDPFVSVIDVSVVDASC